MQGEYPPLPRNAVFLWSPAHGEDAPSGAFVIANDVAHQRPIMGRLTRLVHPSSTIANTGHRATFVAKPDELLASGDVVSMHPDSEVVYPVGEYVDEQPPHAPVVHMAWSSSRPPYASCDVISSMSFAFTLPGSDDHTPSNLMAYALYWGKSETDVARATHPIAIVASTDTADSSILGIFMGHSREDLSGYAALSAIDFAGNESPRSEIVRIDEPSDGGVGCNMRRPGGRSWAAFTLPALALLAWRRRRTRDALAGTGVDQERP